MRVSPKPIPASARTEILLRLQNNPKTSPANKVARIPCLEYIQALRGPPVGIDHAGHARARLPVNGHAVFHGAEGCMSCPLEQVISDLKIVCFALLPFYADSPLLK